MFLNNYSPEEYRLREMEVKIVPNQNCKPKYSPKLMASGKHICGLAVNEAEKAQVVSSVSLFKGLYLFVVS